MGAFDDLVPAAPSTSAFADLVPKGSDSVVYKQRQIGGAPPIDRSTEGAFKQAVASNRSYADEATKKEYEDDHNLLAPSKYPPLPGMQEGEAIKRWYNLVKDESLPATMAKIAGEKNAIEEEIKKSPEYAAKEKEIGGKLGGAADLERWLHEQATAKWKASKPVPAEKGWLQSVRELWDSALDHPKEMTESLINGVAADPYLLDVPVLGLAKGIRDASILSKSTKAILGLGEEGAMNVAAIAPSIMAKDLLASGGQSPNTGKDIAMAALPLVASKLALKAGATVGAHALAKDTKAEVAPGNVEELMRDSQRIADEKGIPIEQALSEKLEGLGLAKTSADAIAQAVKERTSDANRDQSGQVLPKTEGEKGQGERGKDMSELDRAKPEDGEEKETKVANANAASDAFLQAVEETKDANEMPPAEREQAIAKGLEASKGKQAGNVDPRLLAALGLAGMGAAVGYALNGNTKDAVAGAIAGGSLALAGRIITRGSNAAGSMFSAFASHPVNPKTVFRDMAATVRMGQLSAQVWRNNVEALLGKISKQERAVSYVRIRDYVQGYRDVELNPNELAAAAATSKFLDVLGAAGQEAGVLPEELLEDYLTGLYKKRPTQSIREFIDTMAQNGMFNAQYPGMSPRTRFAMKKSLPDYRVAESLAAKGKVDFVPLTTNPFEIAQIYAASLAKTIAVKNLIKSLGKTPGPDSYASGKPIPLLVPDTPDGAKGPILRGNAILRDKLQLPDDMIKFQNKIQIANAPRDYVVINHPTLRGYKVHRDLKGPLELLFDAKKPGDITRALYNTSMAAKTMLFMLSMFHASSLAQVAVGLSLPRGITPRQLARTPRFWGSIPGAYQMLHGATPLAPEATFWAKNGLNFTHAPEDIGTNFASQAIELLKGAVDRPPEGVAEWISHLSGTGKKLNEMKAAQKWFSHILWDVVQPTLKLATAMTEHRYAVENDLRRHMKDPTKPLRDVNEMARETATQVNDHYGGLDWFELANNVDTKTARTLAMAITSPSARRVQQVAFLAPDWNIAAIRAWTQGMKAITPGISAKASDSAYRSYLLWSGLVFYGGADALNMQMSGHHIWENEDPTYIDLGNGKKMQVNKHFLELIHLIRDPAQFVLNKMNYLPKEAFEQLFGKEYITKTGGPPMINPSTMGRAGHALHNFAPITIQNVERDPEAAIAGVLGFPIYPTRKTDEEKKKEQLERAEAKGTPDEEAAAAAKRAADSAKKKGKSAYDQEKAAEGARQRALKRRKRLEESAAQ